MLPMIPIDQHTRISTIIQANKDSIEAIASLAKPLSKLKNPILRRLMASRVTLAEAASMGGITVEQIGNALAPLGFVLQNSDTLPPKEVQERPIWFNNVSEKNSLELDVRSLIENGEDPLKLILHTFDTLPQGHALVVINSFIPTPLFPLLAKKGATHYVESKSEELHHTWFYKTKSVVKASIPKNSSIQRLTIPSFEEELSKHSEANSILLDVRGLPAPQPMEQILIALSSLEPDQILHIYHERTPLHLLEELEDSNYTIFLCEYGPENIQLILSNPSA